MKRPVFVLASLWLMLIGIFSAQAQVPTINQPLVPDHALPGASSFTLVVNGTGFVSGASVLWNGSPRTTTFVSSSQIKATILAADVAQAGTATVTVQNPGTVSISNFKYFVISAAHTTTTWGRVDYPAGAQPERQVVADINGDGKADIVSIDPVNNAILVALGNGNGTFQTPISTATGINPSNIAVADFDDDGKLDIVTADYASNKCTLLVGNGNGTFQTLGATNCSTGNGPIALAIGDFNGDGAPDLAVVNSTDDTVAILIQNLLAGKGNDTFRTPEFYPTGHNPSSIVVGDFNHDSLLDLATANFGSFAGNTVSILLANPGGGVTNRFQPKVDYATSNGPLAIVAADFNGDGILDLATANGCGAPPQCGRPGNVSVLLGNSNGTFQTHVDYPVGSFAYSLAAGNFRSGNNVDLVVTNLDSGDLYFLLGSGTGTFPTQTIIATNSHPVGVTPGDFNGDGKMDLVIGGDGPAAATVMIFGNGPDLLETSVSNPPATALGGGHFSVTDTVKNQGDTPAGTSATAYYLSTTPTKTSSSTLLSPTRSVPVLAAAGTSSGSTVVTIPTSMTSGVYYLIACADNNNTVSESNETNNCLTAATQLTLTGVITRTVNFDTTPKGTAIANGASVASLYSLWGVSFSFNPCTLGPSICFTNTGFGSFAVSVLGPASSPNIISADKVSGLFDQQWGTMQANFTKAKTTVSIQVEQVCVGQDAACLNPQPSDAAFIKAFDSLGNLLATATATPTNFSTYQTLTVNSPTGAATIAFVQFTVPFTGKQIAGKFDNMTVTGP